MICLLKNLIPDVQMGKVQSFMILMALLNAFTSAQSNDECMKDVLVLLDTSYSIGRVNFVNKIKPFLKELGRDRSLNVSPQGTHMAILAFSSVEQTKMRLPFHQGYGEQYFNAIDGFRWSVFSGDQTRTDIAFQKAGKIFNQESPFNHRRRHDDVIILLTDGEPFGITNAREKAIAEAQKLKDRGVLIIGLGVGTVNMKTLREISSPGEAVMATFENIHTKLERLAAGSCRIVAPAQVCTCPAVDLGNFIAESSSSRRDVTWNIPQPSCLETVRFSLASVLPNVQSGETFPVGRHNVEYTYTYSGRGAALSQVICDVSFEVVEGPKLCRGKVYSTKQVCCCGQIHEKQDDYQCCGTEYFSSSTHKCCPGSTLRNTDQSCFGHSCKCPTVNLGTKYMKEGDGTTIVTWTVPRPTCGGRLRTIMKPDMRPGQTFAPGVYSIDYVYQTINQIDVTCTVRFEVKECSCSGQSLTIFNAQPGETTTAVTWRTPLPTCPEAIRRTQSTHNSGQLFAIGHHTVMYTFNINDRFDQTCAVSFEVRGALCRNRGYNPANQICCCGIVHNIIPGYDCCGQDYHSLTTQHCCGNSVVRDKAESCPRQ